MGIGLWTVCFFLFIKKGLFEWLYLLRGPILDVWEVSCQLLVNATALPLQKFLELRCTLPKTNIAPENKGSQKEISLATTIFQGRAVKLRGCNCPDSMAVNFSVYG